MDLMRVGYSMFTAVLLFVMVFLAAPTVHAAAGDLDPSFGSGGKATTDFGGIDSANAIILQPDGKILAAGEASMSSGSSLDFALARYHSNGGPDTSFGNSGRVTTDFSGGDSASALARQVDGKILVAGTVGVFDFATPPPTFGAIARYNINGSLDVTFGASGKAITSLRRANAIALQADGKILIAGTGISSAGTDNDFVLARYNTDGSIDTSFGINGLVTTDFGATDYIAAIVLQSDGKIVAGGTTVIANPGARNFALARYDNNGSLDTSFGNGGKVTTNFGAYSDDDGLNTIALQPDGKIVAAGTATGDFAIARYNNNGSLDATFGINGKVTKNISFTDKALALFIQSDGKILLAGSVGYSGGPAQLIITSAIIRYHSNGSLDATFGKAGMLTGFDGSAYGESVGAMAIQADDKLVVAGRIFTGNNTSNDFALARYLGDSGLPQPGWWWNPNESGRGFSVEVSQNTLVMAGYLYDASGRATWYTSAGPMANNTLYQGALQSFGNGQTLSGPYKSNSLTNPNAGTITIQFSDATHGTLTWPGGTIPIERYVFGTGASSFQPESGWWWNESESGRGFTLEVQGNTLVIGGYMYDSQGNPVWYISAGTMSSATLYQGRWEQYANGQTLTGLYKKPDQVNGNVGNITIEFTSRSTATLTLPGGRQIALTRYRF